MDNLGLLKSNTVFMEFGAGRGRYLRFAVIENSCSHSVLSINSSTLHANGLSVSMLMGKYSKQQSRVVNHFLFL